jgi:hypothetical protein
MDLHYINYLIDSIQFKRQEDISYD